MSEFPAVGLREAGGLSLVRIQKITGLGKTTIMRILNKPPGRADNTPGSFQRTGITGRSGYSRRC
jgi:hypothetical protein